MQTVTYFENCSCLVTSHWTKVTLFENVSRTFRIFDGMRSPNLLLAKLFPQLLQGGKPSLLPHIRDTHPGDEIDNSHNSCTQINRFKRKKISTLLLQQGGGWQMLFQDPVQSLSLDRPHLEPEQCKNYFSLDNDNFYLPASFCRLK